MLKAANVLCDPALSRDWLEKDCKEELERTHVHEFSAAIHRRKQKLLHMQEQPQMDHGGYSMPWDGGSDAA
jgi:hypothetical protein